GSAREVREGICQEFTRADGPTRRRVQGPGLGLPLCRKLADLLGGRVPLESALGVGSTFTAVIPTIYEPLLGPAPTWKVDPRRVPVLVVEDSGEALLVYDRVLASARFQVLGARTLRGA